MPKRKWQCNVCNLVPLLMLPLCLALAKEVGKRNEGLEGPRLTSEPSSKIDFANSTGVLLSCQATGRPKPIISWLRSDGSAVVDVPRLRQVLPNGTLVIFPFRAEDYRQDIHTASYHCMAKNSIGSVISRNILTRGVVKQFYKVQVYDEFVINGNLAVLRCHVPSFVKDYVMVTSWTTGDLTIDSKTYGDHYRISSSGELYINDVGAEDGQKTYQCRVRHALTTEITESSPGRLIVTDPKSSVAPRIQHSISLLRAHQGEAVEIPCPAQALPRPKNRWFRVQGKENVALDNDGRYIVQNGLLVIRSADVSDNGKYICVASNNLGEERVETTLSITASLSAYIQPREKVVDAGKTVTFVCVISGFPVTSISWTKNGNPLAASDSFHFPSREVLQISSVRREDKGMFQCFVSNEEQTVQAAAELQLGDAAPVFHQVFSEATMEPGPAVSLQCVASGTPTPHFEWSLDGVAVANAPTAAAAAASATSKSRRVSADEYITPTGDVISHMNISKSKIEDGGEYRCMAVSSVGRVEHSARLNIYGPPYIRPMSNVSVVAGDDVMVTCRATGYPLQSVVWERGGLTLPVNLRQRVHANGTLLVKNVERSSDEGSYTCVVRNENGQQARGSLWMIVKDPPKIEPFYFPRDLSESMRARILCTVVKGDLPIHISWIKDGLAIPTQLGVQQQQADDFSSSLTFRSITSKHRGNYTCIASNSVATVNYSTDLLVYVAPFWTVEPRDISAKQESNAVISCQADGFPTPNTTWMKETAGGEYSSIDSRNVKYSIASNGSLLLEAISKEQEGYYLCQASNGIGSGLSKVVFLTVNVPANFQTKRQTQSVKRWSDAHLLCEPRGDFPIQVNWRINNKPAHQFDSNRYRIQEKSVNNGLISEMVITRSERQDGVIFTCHAKNEYGQAETEIQLVIQEPPSPPTDLKVTDQSSRSVMLFWASSNDGNSAITRHKIKYKDVAGTWEKDSRVVQTPGTDLSANVVDLSPGTAYDFVVIAKNDIGDSAPSNSVQVTLPEEAPGGSPTALQVKVTSSQSLKITWKPPKKTTWNGNLLGYNVGYKMYDSNEPYTYRAVKIGAAKDEEELVVDNLKKHTKYSVVVKAFNRLGDGPISDEIVAHTYEDVPDKPPLGLHCSPALSQSLLITWEPPPSNSHNGIIRGYKVLYMPVKEDLDKQARQYTTTVLGLRTSLDGLEKYQNYSIRVLSYTRVGDGASSKAVYCRTVEDVPGAPADIKALAMTSDAILITWLPPKLPNGIITKYSVYMRINGISSEHATKHTVLPSANLLFEARGLKENGSVEFWVTASTEVGEGESTRVVHQSPKSTVGAQIASFSAQTATPWKEKIKLECRTVGIPAPNRVWKFGSQVIAASSRYELNANGALILMDVRNDDNGNYSCEVSNIYGRDKIIYQVTVYAPPEAPAISILMVNYTSITLKLTPKEEARETILKYNLNYKREMGEWESLEISSEKSSCVLSNLHCGSRYQMYVTATNSVGAGEQGPMVKTSTKGAAPKVPPLETVLKINTTFVILHLEDWPDQGCPILYFVVQYSSKEKLDWILISNNIQPSEKHMSLSGLQPGTWYILHVTAHNDAGSTITQYQFSTLTLDGEAAGPPKFLGTSPSRDPFYRDLNLMIPVLASMFSLLGAVLVIFLLVRRRKHREGINRIESSTYTSHKNLIVNNDGRNFASEKNSAALQSETQFTMTQDETRIIKPTEMFQSGCNLHHSLENISSYHDDICPYASVSLSDCRNNKTAHDFHLHVFRQHQTSDDLLEQKVACETTPMDTYSRVRKKSGHQLQISELQLRAAPDCDSQAELQSSETNSQCFQGSENRLGSCYPLPRQRRQSIEYDSVLSDSDTTDIGVTYYTESVGQLHDRSRVPDLIYHATDSSSSNEGSPDEDKQIESHLNQRNYSSPRLTSRDKWWHPESEASERLEDMRQERNNALHAQHVLPPFKLLPTEQFSTDFLTSRGQYLGPSETSSLLKRKSKHLPVKVLDQQFHQPCKNLPL